MEITKCSDIAVIETILETNTLSYCSRWIPIWQNMVLYTSSRRLKVYAIFEFPVNMLKTRLHCSQSPEWSIEETERVTYTNLTGEVCSVTNLSFGVEDLFKSIDTHIEKTKNRTVTIEIQSFIDIFTVCNYNEMIIIPNKIEQLTNPERLRNRTTTENKLIDDSKTTISGNGQNYCFYTSHLGLPPDSVISLMNSKRPPDVQPPQKSVVCLVYPLYGAQYNNQATPSYPTQVSGENGHSEITPSFTSLPYGQCGEVGNRAEQLHTPSNQTQNIGQHMSTTPTQANNSQPVGVTNTSNGLRTTDSIRGNESGNMTYSSTLSRNVPAEPRPPARHSDYRDHYHRLLSYTNWPGNVRQDPTHLCHAGFFYTGNVDLVRCFQCGIGLKDFRPDDEPLIEHVRYSADCYFLLELLGQAQLAEYKRNVMGHKSSQGTFQQQQRLQEEPNQRQVPHVGAHYQYNGQSTHTSQSAKQPVQQHQVTTPYGQAPHLRPSDLRSTAINHTSVTNQHYTIATSQQKLQQAGQHGPIPPNTAAGVTYRHPEYALLDTRLASFAKWPPGIMQTPRQIAEAGFFYTGMGDVVRCWACDGGLQKWDPQDDPWVEHCYYFPTCPYAIQQKGSGYIALVQQQAREITPVEGRQNNATNSSEAQLGTSSSGINDDLQNMTIAEHGPVLSTVAAQSLLEMGYDEKKIKRAFEKLKGQGITEPTAEQIVDTIEGGDGNIPNNNTQQSNEMPRSTSAVFH